MPVTGALARFMEARSAIAERASSPSSAVRPTGVEMSLYLTELLDAALVEMAASHVREHESGFGLVAVGGYGRREIARHSDVDVMLLIEGNRDTEGVVRMLYPLWDANLKVGHSVRTVSQVAEAARASVETFTSVLDARLLSGDMKLFVKFEEERQRFARRSRGWMRSELATRRAVLLEKQPWQLLAVDLKTGRGGLRDLHAMHWLQAVDAIADGAEVEPMLQAGLRAARETLMRTRHAVHSTVERPSDVYRPEGVLAACRWLDVDPWEWSRKLFTEMRAVDAAALAELRVVPSVSLAGSGVGSARETGAGLSRLWPWSRRPQGQSQAAPSSAARTEPASEAEGDLEALREALRHQPGVHSLDPLPVSSWLQRLLPEWESIRARPHVAPFHIHPVDVHSIRAVSEAHWVMRTDEFEAGTPEVAAAFGRPDEVLLAAMLHDVGKGYSGVEHPEFGALVVERFAARAGLGAAETKRLVAAVRHHLLLPAVATRRDIADEQVIREVAETVGDLETLRLLYMLSVADARASGPNVWNQWKAQLMRSLFDRVSTLLESEGPVTAATRSAPDVETVAAALAGRVSPEEVRAHLEGLEQSYLISTSPSAVGDHIELIAEARAHGGAAARRESLGEIDRLTIVCPDRPGLLQDIAGTLAGFSVSMLGGVAYTRVDGIAIEVWHVADALGVGIDERRWGRILEAIPLAARGEYDIRDRLDEVRRSYPQPPKRQDIETKVHVDNRASRDYSVLEISAPDRRGLLYAVTRALHELRIDIHLAKVDTIGPEVFDAFYIRRENGSRIEEPDEIERLQRRIASVLAGLD